MKPTDELMKEHRAIESMLRIMGAACKRLDGGADVSLSDLWSMITFLKVFADQCHHGKEEELLFPALEAAGVPREHGPIGVMLSEHTLGRSYVRQMSEAVDLCASGDQAAKKAFVQSARVYINLLQMHIHKEDHILFPMADTALPADVQTQLLQKFDRVETEKIGVGRHEEFHRLLNDLRAKYVEDGASSPDERA